MKCEGNTFHRMSVATSFIKFNNFDGRNIIEIRNQFKNALPNLIIKSQVESLSFRNIFLHQSKIK